MRINQLSRVLLVVSALSLSNCITGCIAVGEGDKSFNTQPTLGRQLCDLKQARDTGAISDTEYTDAKSKLVNGELPQKH